MALQIDVRNGDTLIKSITSRDKILQLDTAGSYLDNNITIDVVSAGTDTSDATATADKIVSGYTAYVGSGKVTGTVPIFNGEEEQTLPYLCFTANTAGSTVAMTVSGTPKLGQNFQTSTNGTSWTEFVPGTTVITLSNIGDKVYFKGNNPNGFNEIEGNSFKFTMSGSIAASGNIMSLLDNGACTTLVMPNRSMGFMSLFENCSSLTTPPELPATTLRQMCYQSMFSGCENLSVSPVLPATTVEESCYSYMFAGCTSLVRAPHLPATVAVGYCYSYMFAGCTSLTTAPKLPATTLSEYCYSGMFGDCTSLIVSDTSGSGYDKTWVLPESGVGSGDYDNYLMFAGCAGTRSTDSPNLHGVQKTYYTQNTPI